MKLLLCTVCNDVITLTYTPRTCECERVSGKYYNNGLHAVYHGDSAVPLGFANGSFNAAVERQPASGMGENFTAFVIPKECPTFEQVASREQVFEKEKIDGELRPVEAYEEVVVDTIGETHHIEELAPSDRELAWMNKKVQFTKDDIDEHGFFKPEALERLYFEHGPPYLLRQQNLDAVEVTRIGDPSPLLGRMSYCGRAQQREYQNLFPNTTAPEDWVK